MESLREDLEMSFWGEMRLGMLCIEAGRPSGARGCVLAALRIANSLGCKQRRATALRVLNWLRAVRS